MSFFARLPCVHTSPPGMHIDQQAYSRITDLCTKCSEKTQQVYILEGLIKNLPLLESSCDVK